MQSQNDEGMILYAKMLKQKELDKSIAEAQSAGATQHRVSELPREGEIIELRGLKFKVRSVDYRRARIQLVLVRPEK